MRAVRNVGKRFMPGSIPCRVNAGFRTRTFYRAFQAALERRLHVAGSFPGGRFGLSLLLGWLLLSALPFNLHAQSDPVGLVPEALREELKLDPFYQRYLAVGPLPIFSSTNASDFALREAGY